jgi:hypothetical protein
MKPWLLEEMPTIVDILAQNILLYQKARKCSKDNREMSEHPRS